MKVFLEIAYHNLVQARRRTFLLGIGLLFVTFLLVSLLGFSESISRQLLRAATTLSSGHVNVAGFNKAKPSDAGAYISGVKDLRAFVLENVPDVDYVIDRYRGWVQLSSETDSLQTGVAGVDIAEEPQLDELLSIAPRSAYREGEGDEREGSIGGLAGEDTIVIFASHAKQLNVRVGDSLTMISQNPDGVTNTKDVRLVGVAEDISMLSMFTVFTPKKTLQDLYTLPDDTSGAIHIFLKDPSRSEEAMSALRQALVQAGHPVLEPNPQPFFMKFETIAGDDWIGQKLDVTFWKDEISFLVWILTVVDAVSFVLVSLLLVIIAVGIMNTMWIAVRERTSEIGTLRAIGMSRRRVLLMFLLEAALLGIVFTLIGGLLGMGGAALLDAASIEIPHGPIRAFLMSDRWRLAVTPLQVVVSVAGITAVTVFASLWPAIRASRLQPITAISSVN